MSCYRTSSTIPMDEHPSPSSSSTGHLPPPPSTCSLCTQAHSSLFKLRYVAIFGSVRTRATPLTLLPLPSSPSVSDVLQADVSRVIECREGAEGFTKEIVDSKLL
jgi:hypothetical protein